MDELRALRRGDPWLSAGLLTIGDPLYLVKREAGAGLPTLLHIPSIADVELFGIDSGNYGQLVMDRGTWEARFGLSTDFLLQRALAPATSQGPAATARGSPVGAAPAPSTARTADTIIRKT